jgi:hypothetical protein
MHNRDWKWKPIDWEENNRGCWICISHKPNYKNQVQFQFNGRKQNLSRIIYSELIGEIPPDLVVRHKCDDPMCINPCHLELGTVKENNWDKLRNGTWQNGENNGQHKLTQKQVDEIRCSLLFSQKYLGKLYGVDRKTIREIIEGKTWRGIPSRNGSV